MDHQDELTLWINRLGSGDHQAADIVWRAYFDKLVRFARQRYNGAARRAAADEEDAVLSAMHSFCRGMQAGRYSQLAGRDDLWRILVTIVVHKIYRQRRHEQAQKRGGGHVRGESAFQSPGLDEPGAGIEQVLGNEPTPELAAMVTENCDHLLAALDDETLKRIALLRLEGFTNQEIAEQLNCTTRSVERKLNRIRERWSVTSDPSETTGGL